jgi:hypothetical protein
MKCDAETTQLWEIVTAAKRAEQMLSKMRDGIEGLVPCFGTPDQSDAHPQNPDLEHLALGAGRLTEVWKAYDRQVAAACRDAVWRFAAKAFGIRPGDQVIFTLKSERRISVEFLMFSSARVGDLAVGGHFVKKDGSLGLNVSWISLLDYPWRIAKDTGGAAS